MTETGQEQLNPTSCMLHSPLLVTSLAFLLIFFVVVFVAVVVVFGFFFSISYLELIIRLYQLLETKLLKGKVSNVN